MSVREELTERIANHIREHYKSSHPNGVQTSMAPVNKGFYRVVTWGYARTMDAEIRVFSPKSFVFRSSRHQDQAFSSYDDLIAWMDSEFKHD